MRLSVLSEATIPDIRHDTAEPVPGVNTEASLANAVWYARNGEYLCSALSVISMIPELRGMVGKGTQYFRSNTGQFGKFFAKYGDAIEGHWDRAQEIIRQTNQLKPYAGRLDRIFRGALQEVKNGNVAEREE